MVWDLLLCIGVWEKQHLRVGMHGEVKFDRVLVVAQEIGHSLHLRLGLWILAAVNVRTGIAGCSHRFINRELRVQQNKRCKFLSLMIV